MKRLIPILLYHSVTEQAANKFLKWTIQPQMFSAHLGYLCEQGYSLLTVSQLVDLKASANPQFPERMALITFDDGYEDFYLNALPLLEQYQFPATLYVTAGYIGQTSCWLAALGESDKPIMSWAQLRDAAARQVEIGAHSMYHPALDIMNQADAYQEIARSKSVLEEGLKLPVRSFSYPHGYHSHTTRALVKQAGYSSVCTVENSISDTETDPFALARITITRATDTRALAALLMGKGLVRFSKRERFTTTGWRMLRRFISSLRTSRFSHVMDRNKI